MSSLAVEGRSPRSRYRSWFDWPAITILGVGVAAGLLAAAVMLRWTMNPPPAMITQTVTLLSLYAGVSIVGGFIVYQMALRYSRWLTLTLTLAFIWAAALTIYIVWQMSRLMFVSGDDLAYAVIFLVFAAVIASSFGLSAASRVTRSLRALASTAGRVAGGDLTARAQVAGRDELASLARDFNRMAERLEEADAQRAEVEALRRDLIAWTSHDLRTPLTSVRALVEALADGVVTDEATIQRYYTTIRSDIIALNELIDDLFELAQLDAGGLVLEMAPHSLGDLVSDTLESFRLLARQRGITLAGEVDPQVDPVVMNAPKIGRVLTNLIGNALRHTPAGGEISVRAGRVNGRVEVSIQDNGPGIPPADLPRIFEQFYRGEQARSRSTGGAGLGLAIARGIVQAHRGTISAANAPEGGAVITFYLPAGGTS